MLKLPPPVWAVAYMVLAGLASRFTGRLWLADSPPAWFGLVLIVLGIALAATAAALFRREGTELNPVSTNNSKLVTAGPFRFTRNPMYLGLVTACLGVAFRVGAWPMFLAPVAIFATANWVHVPFEEEKMRRQFGTAFDTYAREVRRWI